MAADAEVRRRAADGSIAKMSIPQLKAFIRSAKARPPACRSLCHRRPPGFAHLRPQPDCGAATVCQPECPLLAVESSVGRGAEGASKSLLSGGGGGGGSGGRRRNPLAQIPFLTPTNRGALLPLLHRHPQAPGGVSGTKPVLTEKVLAFLGLGGGSSAAVAAAVAAGESGAGGQPQ